MTLEQFTKFYDAQAATLDMINRMEQAMSRVVDRMGEMMQLTQRTSEMAKGIKSPFEALSKSISSEALKGEISKVLNLKNLMLSLSIGVGWQLFGDDILTLLSPAMAALESFAGVVHNLVGGLVPAFAPVVQGLAAAMGIYAAATAVSTAVTWLQVEANQKLLASMLLNPILWVALAIGAVVAAMFQWGAVAESVGTVIGYVFGVAYNLFALLANCVLGFANLVGGTVLGLLSGVLFLAEKLVSLFDAISGTNFAAGIGGARDFIGKLQEGLRSSPLQLETVDPAEMAKKWGQATLNFTQGANTKLRYGGAADLSGFDTVTRNQAAMEQVYSGYGQKNLLDVNSVNTVKSVEGDVNMADEDMQFIKDAAEMRFIQNFVTLTPTMAMNANISGITDVDAMMAAMGKRMDEMMVASAEGVYG